MKNWFKNNLHYILIIIFTIIVFVLIKNSKFNELIVNVDNKAFELFNNIHIDYFIYLFKIITVFGDWYIPILVILSIFILIKNKWYFCILSGSYLFAGLMSFVMKSIILRERPVIALIKIPNSYSFPSGHTLTSIVFYITLCYILIMLYNIKKKNILYVVTVILISLIAISRVYLGVHFLSDVIGGIILGIECEIFIINAIKNNFIKKLKNG